MVTTARASMRRGDVIGRREACVDARFIAEADGKPDLAWLGGGINSRDLTRVDR
jgi:hypothetical protein